MTENFRTIKVKRGSGNEIVVVNNPTSYPLIGKGIQGAVFQLSPEQCVKIYPDERHWSKEKYALETCQHLDFMPKVYEVGPNYIVMEFINGTHLKRTLKKTSILPESVSIQLVDILKQMKQNGFTKIDVPLRHVIVTDEGTFKVVDHVYSFTDDQPNPDRLLQNLGELGLLDQFLQHVKNIDSKLLSNWDKKPKKKKK